MTNEEIVTQIQAGKDVKANLERLYFQNTGLINIVINKYPKQDEEDLRQEAFFGIQRAAELWDETRGGSFSTYCTAWIRQACARYQENYSHAIRVPSHRYQRIRYYKRTVSELREDLGREPTKAELAAALDVYDMQLDQLKADALALTPRSLSDPVPGTAEEVTLQDTIADPRNAILDLEDRIWHEQLSIILWELVDALDTREGRVLRERYQNNKTVSECSASLGMSPAQIRKTESDAIRNLGKSRNRRKLQPYADEILTSTIYNSNGYGIFSHTWSSSQERYIIQQEARKSRGNS